MLNLHTYGAIFFAPALAVLLPCCYWAGGRAAADDGDVPEGRATRPEPGLLEAAGVRERS